MKGSFFDKIRQYNFFRVVKFITESAVFAIFLSLILFGVETFNNMKESSELSQSMQGLSQNLLSIQNSLSTRYLGEFPNFLPNINQLYKDASAGDSIVVFEDVLFYGMISGPKEFYEASLKLFDLAANGSPVLISYYIPEGIAFNFMLQEMLLSPEYYKNYRNTLKLFHKRRALYKQRRRVVIDSCVNNSMTKFETDKQLTLLLDDCFGDIVDKAVLSKQKERMLAKPQQQVDGDGDMSAQRDDGEQIRLMYLEKYFAKTRDANPSAFTELVSKYRTPTVRAELADAPTRIQKETEEMCQKMDSIRLECLGNENEPVTNIKFSDFKKMFIGMTNVMVEMYRRYPSIKLVPIDDFISIRCWFVSGKAESGQAIMAFPSRYSSSEIGFFTTDETTKNYIRTMQRGILVNYTND